MKRIRPDADLTKTGRKRKPFLYHHQKPIRKEVIDMMRPLAFSDSDNLSLERVLLLSLGEQEIALGFVMQRGTLSMVMTRERALQFGRTLLNIARREGVVECNV